VEKQNLLNIFIVWGFGTACQPGLRMIALEVEDMDTAVKYLMSKGVEITWGPITLGKSKRAEIKDPDGLSIELRQW
jgi:glyoxylase I family protein